MNVLRATFLGLVGLSAWLVVLTLSTPVHELGFAMAPPDGPVTESVRSSYDRAITLSLMTGQMEGLGGLAPIEREHLIDVRQVVMAALVFVLLGLIVSLRYRPTAQEARLAARGVFIVGLLILFGFPVVFTWFHQLIFWGRDTWYLPAEQFLLTQLYPLAFFASLWLIGVLLTALCLVQLARVLPKAQSR